MLSARDRSSRRGAGKGDAGRAFRPIEKKMLTKGLFWRPRSSAPARIRLPCWPGASPLAMILTRGMAACFVVLGLALVLLFPFEKQLNGVLRLLGYDDNFISSFPFLRHLYSRLTSVPWTASTDVGYFHLLDVVVWQSIVVWGTWLGAGIVFLKQYDDYFQKLPILASERTRGRPWVIYLGWILVPLSAAVIAYVCGQEKSLRDPEIVFVLKRFPGFYFWIFATLYYFGAALFAGGALCAIWTIFRQKWPGIALWHEGLGGRDRHEQH